MREVRIREDAPWHPLETEEMLDDERHVEADDHQPESPFAEPLRQHPPAHFRNPVVDARHDGEDDRAHGDEMKMRDEIIAVLCLPIERHNRMADSGYAGAKELNEKGDAKQHRHVEAN